MPDSAAAGASIRTLASVLACEVKDEDGVMCLYGALDDENFDEAAEIVAREIAKRRIGANAPLHDVWAKQLSAADGEQPSSSDQTLLVASLLTNVGVPHAAGSLPHLHGLVAEEIWLELIVELDLGLGLPKQVDGHAYSVIDPGGDGLAVHESEGGTLCFRLWESKYHGTASPVRETVQDACRQLRQRALEYLSRFALINQRITDDVELAKFYGLLAQMWADKDPAAGASVVIGSSALQDNWSDTIPPYFELAPDRHQGNLNAMGDFPRFARRVREILWKGCGWTEH